MQNIDPTDGGVTTGSVVAEEDADDEVLPEKVTWNEYDKVYQAINDCCCSDDIVVIIRQIYDELYLTFGLLIDDEKFAKGFDEERIKRTVLIMRGTKTVDDYLPASNKGSFCR